MTKLPLIVFVLALLRFGWPAFAGESPGHPATPAGAPDEWLPSDTVFLFQSPEPEPLLDLLLAPAVTDLAGLEKGAAAGLAGLGRYLETQMGCDWKTVVRRITRQGFTLAVRPGGALVLILQSDEPEFLHKLNDAFLKAGWWGNPANVTQTKHGETVCWTLAGGKEYHAIAGNRLILSNQLPALQRVLDLGNGAVSASESLAGAADYQSAKRATRPDSAAVVYAAPALLQALPLFKRDPSAPPHPMGVLLLGRVPQATQGPGSDWLTLEFGVNGRALSARLAGEWLPKQVAPFASPAGEDGVLPNVQVPRQIAALSLWRDLRTFYAAKDALFPERTSALIFFENLMGIYFSGRDLTDDVMGALDPHVRLVVAEQAYDAQTGTPAVKVPGIAAVFRMRQPERFAAIAEEAWQKALGLVNFTRGQKAQAGLILDKREHEGVRYTFAAFSAAEETDKTKLDMRFNFRPSIARAGEYLILSTTEQLTDDVIDALRRPATPVAGNNGLIEIDGPRLATVLLENRENIVRDNMLKKGQEREAAEKDLNGATTVARMLGQATLRTGELSRQPFVDLRLDFDGASH